MADAANTAKYKNILVINLMHIGDLMLVTPVLRTLRANYPQSRITLLADLKLRDLVEHNKWIDDCMLIDKKGKDDHLLNFIKFIMKIRNIISNIRKIYFSSRMSAPQHWRRFLVPIALLDTRSRGFLSSSATYSPIRRQLNIRYNLILRYYFALE